MDQMGSLRMMNIDMQGKDYLIVKKSMREPVIQRLPYDATKGSAGRARDSVTCKVETTHADLTSLSVPRFQTYRDGRVKHDRLGRPMEVPAPRMFDGLNAGRYGRNDPTRPPRKKTKAAPDEKDGVDSDQGGVVCEAAPHAEADHAAPQEFVGSSSTAVSGL